MLAAGRSLLGVASGLRANFTSRVPGGDIALLAITLCGLLLLSGPHGPTVIARVASSSGPGLPVLGLFLIAFAILANEVIVGRFVAPLAPAGELLPEALKRLRSLQVLSALGGMAVLMRRPIARALQALSARFRPAATDSPLLAVCLAVPWFVLLLATEHGRPERFGWLLPVQVVALAACLTTIRSRAWCAVAVAALVGAMSGSPEGLDLKSGITDRWSGPDHPAVPAVALVSQRLLASGRAQASIGYHEGGTPILTAVGRVGPELDLFFRSHGVSNTNHCPEGISADDEFLIDWSEEHGHALSPDSPKTLVAQFGRHRVYAR
jgi:hypothetical protein